jgi:cytochrome c oxidase subunit 1
MTRRIYTYLEESGWGELNLLATIGAVTIAVSMLVFLANILISLRRGDVIGDDPWGGETLEWALPSPPPNYNFDRIPVVEGRSAMWDRSADTPEVVGLRTDRREVLVTRVVDALPDNRFSQPGPTIWPLVTGFGVAVMFVTLVFTPWGFVIGSVVTFPGLIGWAYPRGTHTLERESERNRRLAAERSRELPT